MGGWRTLHFFDKEKNIKEIVPKVRKTDSYLLSFFNDYRLRWINGFSIPSDVIIKDTIAFISELNQELNLHPKLQEIKKRKLDETYDEYTKRSNLGFKNFMRSRQCTIEFFEYLLIETIFSSVADFNPHFIMGKSIFESNINTKKNSLAEELVSQVTSFPQWSILDLVDGGITSWLSKEEVELLSMDMDNIFPFDNDSLDYVNEFKEFIKMAVSNNCGLISLRNPREDDLTKLQTVVNPNEDIVEKKQFKSILIHKVSS